MAMYDHDATATGYRKDTARYYYESRKYARRAASEYKYAAQLINRARWLANHPDLWDGNSTPAMMEQYAATATSLGDTYLRASFRNMDSARFYTDLAKRYDRMS